jgi:hypothetical protein
MRIPSHAVWPVSLPIMLRQAKVVQYRTAFRLLRGRLEAQSAGADALKCNHQPC